MLSVLKENTLKLSVKFIAAYFTAKNRSLKLNKLKEFSTGLKHTAFWVYFSDSVVSFSVILYVSCSLLGGLTGTSEGM